jgi:hypothetical protein
MRRRLLQKCVFKFARGRTVTKSERELALQVPGMDASVRNHRKNAPQRLTAWLVVKVVSAVGLCSTREDSGCDPWCVCTHTVRLRRKRRGDDHLDFLLVAASTNRVADECPRVRDWAYPSSPVLGRAAGQRNTACHPAKINVRIPILLSLGRERSFQRKTDSNLCDRGNSGASVRFS